MKVLIVDDDQDMVASLERILQGAGFCVESACDGQEALLKNRCFHPDFLIMDIRMPRLNGVEACLAVQRERPEVPVILMTGFSDAVDEANTGIFVRACRQGQVRIMLKPLDLDRVIRIVRSGRAQDALEPVLLPRFWE
ncbi:MAG: response regulator [Verrucomicrobia bacterium]|nr:response regulator [Verrucomicrobiota bacterium]